MNEIEEVSQGTFLEAIFGDYFKKNKGYIEIRQINDSGVKRGWFNSVNELSKNVEQFSGNICFGVCPRFQRKGDRQGIKHITALWTDIDIGEEGHKKKSHYEDYSQAEKAIKSFLLKPSIIVDSGHGLHLYWLLNKVEELDNEKVYRIENIHRGVIKALNGDAGTGDITKIMRLPGTINYKIPNKPKDVKILFLNPSLKYGIDDFKQYEEEGEKLLVSLPEELLKIEEITELPRVTFEELQKRGILSTILDLIKNGDEKGRYPSRSERDQAVVVELLLKNLSPEEIIAIFRNPENAISDKYLELGKYGDRYIVYSINKAKAFIEAKQIEVEEKKKIIPIPIELNKFLDKFFSDCRSTLLRLDDYKEFNGEHYSVYKKEIKEKDRIEIREYHIKKDTIGPGEKIPLDTMRNAYLISLQYALEQKSFVVEFNLSKKFKLFGKDSISGRERKDMEIAERLLANTQYRSYKKMGNTLIESYQNLYSGIDFIREKETSPIKVRVTLNPSYLQALAIDTGLIKGQYIPLELPLKKPRHTKELYKRKALAKFNMMGKFRKEDYGILPYKITSLFRHIGVKDYELRRLKISREIWEYIKPTIEQAGHKLIKVMVKEGKKQEDVRNWTLILQLKERYGKTPIDL